MMAMRWRESGETVLTGPWTRSGRTFVGALRVDSGWFFRVDSEWFFSVCSIKHVEIVNKTICFCMFSYNKHEALARAMAGAKGQVYPSI